MILSIAIFLVAAAVLVWLAKRADDAQRAATQTVSAYFEERLRIMDEAEEERRLALYKQQKVLHRTLAQSDAAVRQMADHTIALRDEAIGLHQRVDSQLQSKEGGE